MTKAIINSMRTSLRFAALTAAAIFCTTQASAELLCDCAQVVDSCDASVSLNGMQVSIESSSKSCSRVDYLIEGQPYTALIVGGSAELAGPSLPMRDASIIVENCRVCAENGALPAASTSAENTESESSDATGEDTSIPRPMIKVMPDYPRQAWMNKLEGNVSLEFTVNAEGSVQNIKVMNSTSPVFDLPATDAVSRFRYEPAEVDGEPVATNGVQENFHFRLINGGTQTRVTSSSN